MTTITKVKDYWERNPLLSYELKGVGSLQYFDEFDAIKRNDSDKYALKYWQFKDFDKKRILDVGCGPGWLTVNYALNGARVTAIDLTALAVELTKKHLAYKNAQATVQEGNAEDLAFEDNSFDLVISSGVLHHTPDTVKAVGECYRVLKKGGKAKLTFYCKGFLHNNFMFKLTQSVMRLLGVRHPGADFAFAKDVDDFIRQYDGQDNPVGIAKKKDDWAKLLMFVGFQISGCERHFFPRRFIPLGRYLPDFVHRGFDYYFGTMIYFDLKKV